MTRVPTNMFDQKPYSYKLERKNNTFYSGLPEYSILFEDTTVKYLRADHEMVKETINMLNAAYNLGFSSGYVNGELAQVNESNKFLTEALNEMESRG